MYCISSGAGRCRSFRRRSTRWSRPGSIGGAVFTPLWVALIGWIGFPGAAGPIGAVMVGVLWIIAGRYLSATPQALGLPPDGSTGAVGHRQGLAPKVGLGALARDRRFVTLSVVFAFGLFAQIGLMSHLMTGLAPVFGSGDASRHRLPRHGMCGRWPAVAGCIAGMRAVRRWCWKFNIVTALDRAARVCPRRRAADRGAGHGNQSTGVRVRTGDLRFPAGSFGSVCMASVWINHDGTIRPNMRQGRSWTPCSNTVGSWCMILVPRRWITLANAVTALESITCAGTGKNVADSSVSGPVAAIVVR